jgi:hypothetical protein
MPVSQPEPALSLTRGGFFNFRPQSTQLPQTSWTFWLRRFYTPEAHAMNDHERPVLRHEVTLNLHLHHHGFTGGELKAMLDNLARSAYELKGIIMATQQEATAQLTAIGVTLDKISAETTALVAEVAALKAAATTGGTVTPEMQTAIDSISSRANAIDAQVDDLAPNPTPTV